jgi:hypothetical protein
MWKTITFTVKYNIAYNHILYKFFPFVFHLSSPKHDTCSIFLLTLKIPWNQKLVDCCLGSLCEEKWFFFNFFFWTSEIHISQAFREHQARPIPTLYEHVLKFCWKWVLSSFNILWGTPTCSHVAKTTQGLKGRVLRKTFTMSIESWFFTFFHFFSLCFFCSWFCMRLPSM